MRPPHRTASRNRIDEETMIRTLLFTTLLVVVSCGGAAERDAAPGADAGVDGSVTPDKQACARVCLKLTSGACGFPSLSECGNTCKAMWESCKDWPAAVSCFDSHNPYSCSGGAHACASELSALLDCDGVTDSGTDASLFDCVPGQELPPCKCDGSVSVGGLCPPSSKAEACPCQS